MSLRHPSVRATTVDFAAGAVIMGTGLAIAALARLPFAWDGAWFFVHAMDS